MKAKVSVTALIAFLCCGVVIGASGTYPPKTYNMAQNTMSFSPTMDSLFVDYSGSSNRDTYDLKLGHLMIEVSQQTVPQTFIVGSSELPSIAMTQAHSAFIVDVKSGVLNVNAAASSIDFIGTDGERGKRVSCDLTPGKMLTIKAVEQYGNPGKTEWIVLSTAGYNVSK